MLRRRLLTTLVSGVPISAFLLGRAGTAAAAAASEASQSAVPMNGFDLREIPVIDVHMHPPEAEVHSQGVVRNTEQFVKPLVPVADFPGKDQYIERVTREVRSNYLNNPKEVGLRQYVSRVYGVEPTMEGIDSVARPHIAGGYTAYIQSVMDRENISGILLQSADKATTRPASLIPNDRYRWSYHVDYLFSPSLLDDTNAASIEDVIVEIDRTMESCVANDCVGFKLGMAYRRKLAVDSVSDADAKAAFAYFRSRTGNTTPIVSDDVEGQRKLKAYEDYLIHHICIKAGELRAKIIIHTAVALHPGLRTEFNNPSQLYGLFQDDLVKRAETEFVLIHAGYPNHHNVAAFLSQFPNVYADMSFFSSCPGALEEILRAVLALAPSEKIMHGTDWRDPEVWGFSAFTLRSVLAKVLVDYRETYGWSQAECERIARNVLSDNAKRIYGFTA